MLTVFLAISLPARAFVTINDPGNQNLPQNADTVYTFYVTNNDVAGDFLFFAFDDQGFIISQSHTEAFISAGGTVAVSIVVNPGASAVGTVNTLLFAVLPLSETSDFVIVEVEGTVIGERPAVAGMPQGILLTTGAMITDDGDVLVWGFRNSGQQGNGVRGVSSNATPEIVQSLSNIVSLAGGAYHLIALDKDGKVYGWGQSGYGETGCKPNTSIYTHTPCVVLTNAVQISGGEYFSIALDEDGKVWTWGHNLYGQLGDGAKKNRQVPFNVNLNGEKARLIGGAYEGAFAVTEEGHVWAWGDNEASGLGFQGPSYGVQKIIRTPTLVTNLTPYAHRITYIAGGNGWGQALLDDGTVIGWGLHAALGQGTTRTNISSPEPVVVMHNVKQLYARYVGSIALTNDGKIYTWGQTGGSAFKMIYGESPTLRQPAGPVVDVGGGKEHLFYKTQDGSMYGVGYNDLYKLDLNKCCGPNVDWPGALITF
ncbi:MAG: hypothetical protein LBI16_01755 [Burkholderiales bacterium]|nr:hypothetical protein [Burkholderiales bacterium]